MFKDDVVFLHKIAVKFPFDFVKYFFLSLSLNANKLSAIQYKILEGENFGKMAYRIAGNFQKVKFSKNLS